MYPVYLMYLVYPVYLVYLRDELAPPAQYDNPLKGKMHAARSLDASTSEQNLHLIEGSEPTRLLCS